MDSYTFDQDYNQALNDFDLNGFDFTNFDFGDDSHTQPPVANPAAFDPWLMQQDDQASLPDNNVDGQMFSSEPFWTDSQLSVRTNSGSQEATVEPANLAYLPQDAGSSAPVAGYDGTYPLLTPGNGHFATGPTTAFEAMQQPAMVTNMAAPMPVANQAMPFDPWLSTGPYFGLETDQAPLVTVSDIENAANRQSQAMMATLPQNTGPSAPTTGQQPTGPVNGGGKRQGRRVRTLAEARAWKQAVDDDDVNVIQPLRDQVSQIRARHGENSVAYIRIKAAYDEANDEWRRSYKKAHQAVKRAEKRLGILPPPKPRKKGRKGKGGKGKARRDSVLED